MDSDDLLIEAFLVRDQANRNIAKVISKSSATAVQGGDNYLSIVERTTVTVLRQSGRKERVSLIVKRRPRGEGRDVLVQESGAFKREIMVYSHVLNVMENLMRENDDQDGVLWCHMLGYNPYDCIVLEDLSAEGFRMIDRHVFLDLDHSLVVMQSLGRFHGLSKVLIAKGQIEKRDFKPYYMTLDHNVGANIVGHCLKVSGKNIKAWGNEWEEVGETFIRYSTKLLEEMRRLGEVPENSTLNVLNHGGIWQCNMLFKYSRYNQKPADIRFIDFQLSHYNTAGWDLIYFLYAGGVDPEIRRNHYDLLLQVYVNEMKKTVASYGLQDGLVAGVDEVKADMTRLLPHRWVATFFFRPLFISKYPFDVEAAMSNTELSETIGMDARSISDPYYRDSSEVDLRELANEINELSLF